MRALVRALVATLVCVLALGACSSGGSDDDPDDGGSADVGAATTSSAAPAPEDLAAALAEVCVEVTAGIDAFNYGDLDETVARFEAAVPLAEAAAEEAPSAETEAMLEAVRYYADLPADDYLEASASSPEFLRHKNTTLTLCNYQGPPADGPSSGVEA
ncbi:hypothetical protein [Nocardioides marinquilinus]|uniref:hypothetical protein n=1 Tax=Nocardioides marinquilinus TaxID=1210400 RepID=UPI0031E8638C